MCETRWTYREGGSLYSYEDARDMALEDLAERPELGAVTLTEHRRPTAANAPDLFASVLEYLAERIQEDDELASYDGCATLDKAPESPEGVALRAALEAYIAKHIDLTEAGWPCTGKEEELTRADLQGEVEP